MTSPTDATGRTDSYFVCATPRTGSSLLLGLLESTGIAGHPQAYFRTPDEPLWAARWRIPHRWAGGGSGHFAYPDYLRAALTHGRTANGVFGAKLMWGTTDELTRKLGTVHPELTGQDLPLLNRVFGRTRFIWLRRDDLLAQAVSWLRAEQTRRWYIGGNGEIVAKDVDRVVDEQAVDEQEVDEQAARFDPDRIGQLIRTAEQHNAAWREWFSSCGVRPYEVRYEDLDVDQTGVTHGILRFLGLDPADARPVVAQHVRQADALNEQWITRYRAERPAD